MNVENTIRTINILAYNISNDIITKLMTENVKVFTKYKSQMETKFKKIKLLYQDGSIRYYHSDFLFASAANPLILEKTGNDFNFWIIEINRTVFGLIERILSYVQNEVPGGLDDQIDASKTLLKNFSKDLQIMYNDLPNKFDLEKNFLSQGPKVLDLADREDYYKADWFKALDNGITISNGIMTNLEQLILSIDLLDKHIKKLKLYKNKILETQSVKSYLKLEDDISEFIEMELRLRNLLSMRIDEMMRFSVFRFANFLKAMDTIEKDLIEAVKEE